MILKNQSVMTSLVFSSLLVLTACSREEEVSEPIGGEAQTPTETPSEANPGGGTENIGGETFGFTEFELEADYPGDDQDFSASYTEDRDRVEAAYSNAAEGLNLEGDDAFDEIEPAIDGLELNPDMPEEEVMTSVVEAFELQDGFESVELEIRYADGTDKEYSLSGQ